MENLSENLEKYIDCISFLYDLSDDVKADEVKNLLENLINEAKDIIAKEISPLENTAKNLELEKEKFLEKLSVCLDIIADDIDQQKFNNNKKFLNFLNEDDFKKLRPEFENLAKKVCGDLEVVSKEICALENKECFDDYFYIKIEKLDEELDSFKGFLINFIQSKYENINTQILNITLSRAFEFFAVDTVQISNKYARHIPKHYSKEERKEYISEIKENYIDYIVSNLAHFEDIINHAIDDYNNIVSILISDENYKLDDTLLKITYFMLNNEKLALMPSYMALSIACERFYKPMRKDDKDYIFNAKYHSKSLFETSKMILKNCSYDEKILKQIIEDFLVNLKKEICENPTNNYEIFYYFILMRSITHFRYALINKFEFRKVAENKAKNNEEK